MSRCKENTTTGERCRNLAKFKSQTLCRKHWVRYGQRQKLMRTQRSKICQVILHLAKETPSISIKEVTNTIHALAGLSVLNSKEVYETIDVMKAVIRHSRKFLVLSV